MWRELKLKQNPKKVRFCEFHFLILKFLKKWTSIVFLYFWELSPNMLGLHIWVIRWYEAKDAINVQIQCIFSFIVSKEKVLVFPQMQAVLCL